MQNTYSGRTYTRRNVEFIASIEQMQSHSINVKLNRQILQFKNNAGAAVTTIPIKGYDPYHGGTLQNSNKILRGASNDNMLNVCGWFKATLEKEEKSIHQLTSAK